MRAMRSVSSEEFQTFVANNPGLEPRRVGAVQCYLGTGEWPDNLLASFMPAGGVRRRDGGWRIAVEEIADEAE